MELISGTGSEVFNQAMELLFTRQGTAKNKLTWPKQPVPLFQNGNKYVGQFHNGFKHGYGTFTLATGDVFSGYYQAGERHGHGIEVFQNGEK